MVQLTTKRVVAVACVVLVANWLMSNQVSVFDSSSYRSTTGKQTASTILPPFSGELRVDKELKLSNPNFKHSIEEFYANRPLSVSDKIKATSPYPTPYVLAQFASMAYLDCTHEDPKPPAGWKLLTTGFHFGIKNGYFGAAYWHPEHQQVVIAHRGTADVGAVVTDVKGVIFNNYVEQMSSASTFAHKVVAVLQDIEQEKKVSFELFFTGHSLGGWLSQVTTFTTEYLEVKGDIFLKKLKREQKRTHVSSSGQESYDIQEGCLPLINTFINQAFKSITNTCPCLEKMMKGEHEPPASNTVQDTDTDDVTHSYHPHAVVFETPGCKDMLQQMTDKLDVRNHGRSIHLQHLDIKSYLSAPNLINTCNSHLGTVYRIFTDLSDMGWKERNTLLYNYATHRMDKILQAFDTQTGQVRKDDKGKPKIRLVVDWPVSACLPFVKEWNDFFQWASHLNNYHPEEMDISPSNVPEGYNKLRYQTKACDECK